MPCRRSDPIEFLASPDRLRENAPGIASTSRKLSISASIAALKVRIPPDSPAHWSPGSLPHLASDPRLCSGRPATSFDRSRPHPGSSCTWYRTGHHRLFGMCQCRSSEASARQSFHRGCNSRRMFSVRSCLSCSWSPRLRRAVATQRRSTGGQRIVRQDLGTLSERDANRLGIPQPSIPLPPRSQSCSSFDLALAALQRDIRSGTVPLNRF